MRFLCLLPYMIQGNEDSGIGLWSVHNTLPLLFLPCNAPPLLQHELISKNWSLLQSRCACSGMESSTDCSVDLCSALLWYDMIHHGLQGLKPSSSHFITVSQGTSCSGAWNISFPPSSLSLVSSWLFHSIFSPSSQSCCSIFLSFFKYFTTEVKLTGSDLSSSWSLLETSGTGLIPVNY